MIESEHIYIYSTKNANKQKYYRHFIEALVSVVEVRESHRIYQHCFHLKTHRLFEVRLQNTGFCMIQTQSRQQPYHTRCKSFAV